MSIADVRRRMTALSLLVTTTLAGCVSGPAPANLSSARFAPGQMADERSGQPQGDWVGRDPSPAAVAGCERRFPTELASFRRTSPSAFQDGDAPLAPGDRIRIAVLGDPDGLTGTYVVGGDGGVAVRGVAKVIAAGGSIETFEERLRESLLAARIVRPLSNAVRATLLEQGGVPVSITGAVFEPGSVRTGERPPESRIGLKEGLASGDDNSARTLAAAVRAAGGVRPDADVAHVYVIRGDSFGEFDLSGLVTGQASRDVALTAGDRVIVPSRSCFDASLVRPSPLTQPGIRVYMSNLTRSANNNAGAAIGEKTTSLPYGTRFLQALVAANCVGGSYLQADRRAVLISRNRMNGESIVIERDIEKLVRGANRDAYDPYLMPGDAIACYDSRWTNLSEAIGMVSSAFGAATPALLVRNAVR